jgi:prophage antirepressor-like protein
VEALAKIFDFEGSPVRTVLKDGEPWFVAKDVCDILGYLWCGTKTVEHVPAEWRGVGSVPTPSGNQDMAVLSEQGLYFFLSRSDKPKALPFQKWVSGNVLPKIRREGMYLAKPVALEDLIIMQAQSVKELKGVVEEQGKALQSAQQTLAQVKDTFAAHPDEWRKTIKDGIDKIAVTQNKFFQFVWGEFYDLLEERGHCDLKIRLKHVRARMAAQGISKSKIADVNRLDTLEEDPVLQELALAIVKEMVAKYAA